MGKLKLGVDTNWRKSMLDSGEARDNRSGIGFLGHGAR
jgi:hypothetical protein